MVIVFFCIYGIALSFMFCYSLIQAHLVYQYLRRGKIENSVTPLLSFPCVTIQLPVYNERYVIERLIDAVAAFDYPRDKLQIQVLDDSTDETVELISQKVKALQANGFNMDHVRRTNRIGFKAGALEEGLSQASGEFIAIFDADFIPAPDFLQKTVPYFTNPEIGMVQTRWQHLNRDYSLLTQLQAFALNAHFTVEQTGRNKGGYFINFNGTGGIWRKSCIEDAGGWSADTLTEDLDLSYRAQLKGWKFRYLENVGSPAELPPVMSALKSQQYRWTKGAAETARKHVRKVLGANISIGQKLHGTFHLLNSCMFLCVMICALLSVPAMFISHQLPQYTDLFQYASLLLFSLLILGIMYWISFVQEYKRKRVAFWHFIKNFPLFLAFSMGLSLHNAIAIMEGLLGIKTPFVRTPKFNLMDKSSTWKTNAYVSQNITPLTVLEGLLMLYFLFGVVQAFLMKDYRLLPFHLMLSFGFGGVFYYSLFHAKRLTK